MDRSLHKSAEARKILDRLELAYPDAHCELDYGSNFQLLVSVILSAQCTDKRVNAVTKVLFQEFSTPEAFAAMLPEELEKRIFSCGFYRNKAKNIILASREILQRFGGQVPSTMEELLTLPGVGRKTANVMRSVAFQEEAFAVDTHVFRVSNRLGFADGKSPEAVEQQVVALLGQKNLSKAHHLLIFHGRYCCHSQRPDCGVCPVREDCKYFAETGGKQAAQAD